MITKKAMMQQGSSGDTKIYKNLVYNIGDLSNSWGKDKDDLFNK